MNWVQKEIYRFACFSKNSVLLDLFCLQSWVCDFEFPKSTVCLCYWLWYIFIHLVAFLMLMAACTEWC